MQMHLIGWIAMLRYPGNQMLQMDFVDIHIILKVTIKCGVCNNIL